jgi:putative glycosyltransferase (TIGR04348 family)
MNVRIVAPASRLNLIGNRLTALRYVAILKSLGHRIRLIEHYDGGPCDVMIALHARRSFPSIGKYRELSPDGPLVLVLTGTDVYRDIASHARAKKALELATRLVVLQPGALEQLPARHRAKARVIYQSAASLPARRRIAGRFTIAVIGHLRKEKDPFRAALASRMLPALSRIEVLHVGRPLTSGMKRRAVEESSRNPRYHWLGELSNRKARLLLARCNAVAVTSLIEGGSNVLCEALAARIPVLASHISGLVGTLGEDYPGYFRAGDTGALAGLMWRAESDRSFYLSLAAYCTRLRRLVSPSRERKSWRELMAELSREKE